MSSKVQIFCRYHARNWRSIIIYIFVLSPLTIHLQTPPLYARIVKYYYIKVYYNNFGNNLYRCTCADRWPTCTCTTRLWKAAGTWSLPGSRLCCMTAGRPGPETSPASRYYSWSAARASRCGGTRSTTWPRTRSPAKGSTPCACRPITPSWSDWASTVQKLPSSCGRTSIGSRPTRRTSGCPAPETGRRALGNRNTDRRRSARTSRTYRRRAASSTSPTSRYPIGPDTCPCRISCQLRRWCRLTPHDRYADLTKTRETVPGDDSVHHNII